MKKLIIVAIACCSSLAVKAQNNSAVDEKNGFKDFHLGDSFQKWAAAARYIDNGNKSKVYKYTGTCCNDVFGKPVQAIVLTFSEPEKKLICIEVFTPKVEYHWMEGFLTYYEDPFKKAFGEPSSSEHNTMPNGVLERYLYQWYGKKACVELNAYYGPTENGEMHSRVRIFDVQLAKKPADDF